MDWEICIARIMFEAAEYFGHGTVRIHLLKVFLTSILKTLVESDDISSVFFY
jgi:hypothetical protein